MIEPDQVPVIPRGVRIHFDKVRDMWVLLAPERAINLDEIGLAILQEIDNTATFADVTAALARKYNAPLDMITTDSAEFILSLTERRILELAT